jgi:hypothetical protein
MALFRIRFITESGFVSWAIRSATFSEFSHAEIISEDQQSYIGARSDGGVQIRPLDYCKPTFERRYAIPCTDEQLANIMASARADIGKPYSYEDIGGLLFHKNLPTHGGFMCSMWTYLKATTGPIWMLNVLPGYANLVTPDYLHLSPLLRGNCYYSTVKP